MCLLTNCLVSNLVNPAGFNNQIDINTQIYLSNFNLIAPIPTLREGPTYTLGQFETNSTNEMPQDDR